MRNNTGPSFIEEKKLKMRGYRRIAGIDEAGRGPLAGPVVAAAVILPDSMNYQWMAMVNDSKKVSLSKRELLCDHIKDITGSIGVGIVNPGTIDIIGIVRATRLAMKLAVERLSPSPDYLIIDYMSVPEIPLPQKGITRGDSLCFSIACASIIAKVTRDRLMTELDVMYPGYKFSSHKGYGTREHIACLKRLGPSPVHRYSFRPVKDVAVR